jgi:hypothetical protein
MRKILYIFVMFFVSSCYNDYNLFGDLDSIKKHNGEYYFTYISYYNEALIPYKECQVSMTLTKIDYNDEEFFSKNQLAFIYDGVAKVDAYLRPGRYQRYMHILVFPDEVDLCVWDTIKVEI